MQILILAATTLGVATFASLVGVGGGFLIMPVLLFMYPGQSQETLTFISLFAVLVGAMTGMINYARMKRIDYKTGLILGACTIPTAIVARFLLPGLDRSQFSQIMGVLLVTIGLFVLWRVRHREGTGTRKGRPVKPGWSHRKIADSAGIVYEYAFPLPPAIGTALAQGFVASFFGIGGGPLMMPVMTEQLCFPPHVATSTSILVLSASAFAGVATDVARHLSAGTLGDIPVWLALAAGLGAFAGAQIGTRLSRRVNGKRILILLAFAVILAGARLVLTPNHKEPPAPESAPRVQSENLIHVKAARVGWAAREVLPC